LAVNYVAIVGFLDLLAAGGSPIALIRGIGEVAVVVILLVYRPWFVRRRGTAEDREDA
jgi:hypothetical protein